MSGKPQKPHKFRKGARTNDTADPIHFDLRVRSDAGCLGRLLRRAQRRYQHRSGGHHGHRRSGRRSGAEIHAGLRGSAGHGHHHRHCQRSVRHDIFFTSCSGCHQLQGRPDHHRHRYEYAGNCCGHRGGEGHEHRGLRRQRRVLRHLLHPHERPAAGSCGRVRAELVHAGGGAVPDRGLCGAVQDPLRSAAACLR